MNTSAQLIHEVESAAKEGYNPELDDLQIQEDKEECKVDFELVTNEVKEAAQEAISKQTIQAYKGSVLTLFPAGMAVDYADILYSGFGEGSRSMWMRTLGTMGRRCLMSPLNRHLSTSVPGYSLNVIFLTLTTISECNVTTKHFHRL